MAEDPPVSLVTTAVEYGVRLLGMGAADKAYENFRTAVMMNTEFVKELLSDDEAVAKRAANRRLPDTDVLTYATTPLIYFYRLLWQRGEASRALKGAQIVVSLYTRLDLFSPGTVECLEEVSKLARQVGDHEYARQCSGAAREIRERIA